MTSINEFKARVMSSQTAALEEIENAYELITYELDGWLEAAQTNSAAKEHLRFIAWLMLSVERSKAWLRELFSDAKATLTRWSNIMAYRTKHIVKAKLREFAPDIYSDQEPDKEAIASADLVQAVISKPDNNYNNAKIAAFLMAGYVPSEAAENVLKDALTELAQVSLPEAKQLYDRLSLVLIKVKLTPKVTGKFLKL